MQDIIHKLSMGHRKVFVEDAQSVNLKSRAIWFYESTKAINY